MTDRTRSPPHTPEQYMAACEWAERVYNESTTRSDAIERLSTDHALNRNSAGVLINNYRSLRMGQAFRSPMSANALRYFAERIVALYGVDALPGLIVSIQGYVSYASRQWGHPSDSVVNILEELLRQRSAFEELNQRISTATAQPLSVQDVNLDEPASEVLREIWARGPQHALFRRELFRRWSGLCSVHGVSCNGQLRASHIVAWRLDVSLRGDVNNGLLLSVPLDNLFDQGLIAFADDGALMQSHQLDSETARHFGLRPGLQLKWDQLTPSERQAIQANLVRHRTFHIDRQQHQYVPLASAP